MQLAVYVPGICGGSVIDIKTGIEWRFIRAVSVLCDGMAPYPIYQGARIISADELVR